MLTNKNLGIVILSPDSNSGALKCTINSLIGEDISNNYITVVPKYIPKDGIKELNKYSKICVGENTITSLINKGLEQIDAEWKLVIISGTWIRYCVIKKYNRFLKEEKDILYPVVKFKYKFDEASINGILLNKKAINEIGYFATNTEDIKLAKLIWANEAINKGYKLKAIVGGRLS